MTEPSWTQASTVAAASSHQPGGSGVSPGGILPGETPPTQGTDPHVSPLVAALVAAPGPILREAREAWALTQAEVATLASTTRGSVVRLEAGRDLPFSMVARVAAALDVSLAAFDPAHLKGRTT